LPKTSAFFIIKSLCADAIHFFLKTILLKTAGRPNSNCQSSGILTLLLLEQLPVILNTDPEHITADQWGLIPPWMKKNPKGIINARIETITKKPSFRVAVKKHRCPVLADNFFEWNRRAGVKTPYRILLRN